jgi:hypothetical protein
VKLRRRRIDGERRYEFKVLVAGSHLDGDVKRWRWRRREHHRIGHRANRRRWWCGVSRRWWEETGGEGVEETGGEGVEDLHGSAGAARRGCCGEVEIRE